MNVFKYIINYGVSYYKKGSIFTTKRLVDINFFLPSAEIHVKYSAYLKDKNYLIDSMLVRLNKEFNEDDYNYYLVLEDMIVFSKVEHFCLNNNINDFEEDFDENYISYLYDDIKDRDELTEFNEIGKLSFNINCVIEEYWTYCMGEWDNSFRYIGVVKDDINTLDLITPKGVERIKEYERIEKSQYDNISDFMELGNF